MRMIDRVHRDAAYRRPLAQPTITAGLAQIDVSLVGIGYGADRRHAVAVDHAELPGAQLEQRHAGIAVDEPAEGTGGQRDLTRKSVEYGKSVSVSDILGGGRIITKKNTTKI